jgi:hypothetical protein
VWAFTQCIHLSVLQHIGYCMYVSIGLGGYPSNNYSLYASVSRTSYLILCGCCCRIRRTQNKYPSTVCIGQPDILSNIVWMLPSDSADTERIFIYCMTRSAGYPIKYCIDRCCRVRRMQNEYSSTVCIGQPDTLSNIVWMLPSDSADTQRIFIYRMTRSVGYPI